MDVAEQIKEALRGQMGPGRYALWFGEGVVLHVDSAGVTVSTDNAFAADRLRARHLSDVRHAARQVLGPDAEVRIIATAGDEASADDQVQEPASAAAGDRARSADPPSAAAQSVGSPAAAGGAGPGTAATAEPPNRPAPRSAGTRPTRRRSRGPQSVSVKMNGNRVQMNAGGDGATGGAATTDSTQPPQTRWSMSLKHFVVGACNELAHTATRMVVEQPGSASPVFLWGPSGTGKTHLLTAVREVLRRKHRLPRVIQLTAEDFTNDFTTALRGSGLPTFRRRYRDVDALIIDDVQFFGGNKRATLRELQHTVDALLRSRKQLMFAADRPPGEIDGLPTELAGRLSGGMLCSVRPLDEDCRRSVLQQFAAMVGLELPESLLTPLAGSATGDGRVLSGLINQIRALAQLRGQMPTWQQVLDSAAGDILRSAAPVIGMNDIQKAVCDAFGLPTGTLQSRGQTRSVSQPRMLAMYLARQYTRAAYSEIGGYFGNRSHSTVIAATKRVECWLQSETAGDGKAPDAQRMRQAAATIENMLRTG